MTTPPSRNDVNAELIRTTIKASMLEVTNKFRDEMTEMLKQYYNREMVDRFNKELKDDIDAIREEIQGLKNDNKQTQLDLDKLWENTFVRLALVAGAVYTILQLWQSLPHP